MRGRGIEGELRDKERIKLYYAHVPTPQDEMHVLQTGTNKIKQKNMSKS